MVIRMTRKIARLGNFYESQTPTTRTVRRLQVGIHYINKKGRKSEGRCRQNRYERVVAQSGKKGMGNRTAVASGWRVRPTEANEH